MARGIQIQKQSNRLTRAQLTEISRANWQLINELKAINEEIAQELASTYQDSRELGRKLKGRLIATQASTAVAGAAAGEGSVWEPGPVLPETPTSSSSSPTQALGAPRGPAPTPAR